MQASVNNRPARVDTNHRRVHGHFMTGIWIRRPAMRRIYTVLAFSFSLICAGQVFAQTNPYQQFFKPFEQNQRSALPFRGEPELLRSAGDREATDRMMFEQGYAPIGASSFTGPLQASDQAVAWARTLGASHVVLFSRSTDNENGKPLQQVAIFYASVAKVGVGMMLRPIPEGTRAALGLDDKNGVQVHAVRKDMPAAAAGIQANDIILAINEEPAVSPAQLIDLLRKYAGQKNELTILRNGQPLFLGLPLYESPR